MIKAGTKLTARSVCDHNCIFEAEVISSTDKTVKVKCRGIIRRCKIHDYEGKRFIYALGRYSMAPVFEVNN